MEHKPDDYPLGKDKQHKTSKRDKDTKRKISISAENQDFRQTDMNANRYFIFGGLALVALIVGLAYINSLRTEQFQDITEITPAAGEMSEQQQQQQPRNVTGWQ